MTSAGTLFDLTFLLAAPFWLLMIFAPTWSVTTRIVSSPLTAVPVAVVYAVLVAPVFPEVWAAVTGPELPGFQELMTLPNGAAAVWAHIIAWDLLVGQWMFLQGRKLGFSPWLMGPLLVLAILLSPLALLVFLALRATRRNTARQDEARHNAVRHDTARPVASGD
ncbi:ABA4-like family protein [Streptomyces sp. P11-1]|uniref:ABA4-like family protein n=1 Tax=Streptomyces sp. P11-1 TaxID=3423221 RepID=UPI003D2EE1BD